MTTWYVDLEGGTDGVVSVGTGDSFATRRKKLDNISGGSVAAGDSVRVMGSPAPTSLGITGLWTGIASLFTFGNDYPVTKGISATTNTSPIQVTTTSTHGYVTGQTIGINSHLTNTNANGTWEITVVDSLNFTLNGSVTTGVAGGLTGNALQSTHRRVQLASAVNKTIALTADGQGGKPNWTASANVTCTTVTSDKKQGAECQQIAIAAAFTTGLAAFWALPASTDFSAYKQVTFWIKGTLGSFTTANLSLRLCSDVAGVTTVNTINIPFINITSVWMPVTVDTGGALGAAIQSIALYVDSDQAAQTLLLDNIVACKDSASADSLSLTSLISKNTGNELWYSIASISGTRVCFDGTGTNLLPTSSNRGYYGTTETVTTYKRETVKVQGIATNTDSQALTCTGASGNLINVEGGWNRTDMTTQTLETWIDGGHRGNGLNITGTFNRINKLNFVRHQTGVIVGAVDNTVDNCIITNTNSVGFSVTVGARLTITGRLTVHSTSSIGFNVGGAGGGVNVSGTLYAEQCASSQIAAGPTCYIAALEAHNGGGGGFVSSAAVRVGTAITRWNATSGMTLGQRTVVQTATSEFNGTQGIVCAEGSVVRGGSTQGNNTAGLLSTAFHCFFRNFTVSDTTPIQTFTDWNGGRIHSENHNNTSGNHNIFCDVGNIVAQTAVRHTASGIAWAMSPTVIGHTASHIPLDLSIAKIAVAASTLVTVKAWMRRTNTGLTHRINCRGGQIGGVASDVTASMSAAADTWEELTITFTPSEAGVVEIHAECYGGTTFTGYVDDLTVTQA